MGTPAVLTYCDEVAHASLNHGVDTRLETVNHQTVCKDNSEELCQIRSQCKRRKERNSR